MSNRSRGQRAVRPRPRLSVDERSRTMGLYLRYADTNRVGEELGISGSAVRDRLFAMGAVLRPQGFSYIGRDWEKHNRDILDALR